MQLARSLPAIRALVAVGLTVLLVALAIRVVQGRAEPFCEAFDPVPHRGVDPYAGFTKHDYPPEWMQAYGPHPVNVAQWGLAYLEAGDREAAREQADILLSVATDDGFLPYNFDRPTVIGDADAPWYSAMAQGQALSLFTRLGMMDAADRTFATLPSLMDDGWYLIMPVEDPVLNGHIWTLYGLYDYWQATGKGEAELRAGIRLVGLNAHRFRQPGERSWYDLEHRLTAGLEYHPIHVAQLRTLYDMTGEPCLRDASEAFASDA